MVLHRRLRLVLLAWLLAPGHVSASARCEAELKAYQELRDRLDRRNSQGRALWSSRFAALAGPGDASPDLLWSPLLVVEPARVLFWEGRLNVASTPTPDVQAALAAQLAEEQRRARLFQETEPASYQARQPLAVAFLPQATGQDIQKALATIQQAGVSSVFLLFRGEEPGPPPSSPLDGELGAYRQASPWHRPGYLPLQELTAPLVRTYALCQEASEFLNSPGHYNLYDLERALDDNLGDGLRSCECRADMPSVLALMWTYKTHAFGEPVKALSLKLAAGGEGQVLRLSPRARWEELAELVVRAARTGAALRFELGPDRP